MNSFANTPPTDALARKRWALKLYAYPLGSPNDPKLKTGELNAVPSFKPSWLACAPVALAALAASALITTRISPVTATHSTRKK